MPKRGKGREEDGNTSSGDSDGDAPAKKDAKRSFGGSSDDGIVVCEISRNRRVSVRVWQGKPTVDICEFYVKDGKQMPGKKGLIEDEASTSVSRLGLADDQVSELAHAEPRASQANGTHGHVLGNSREFRTFNV
ncbi:RNA polymerase II transcriptional coactivator [Nymphaea thermarum]|nr:RNA polymerase II transcriptional coactivator [Nymphaea thermarum]